MAQVMSMLSTQNINLVRKLLERLLFPQHMVCISNYCILLLQDDKENSDAVFCLPYSWRFITFWCSLFLVKKWWLILLSLRGESVSQTS